MRGEKFDRMPQDVHVHFMNEHILVSVKSCRKMALELGIVALGCIANCLLASSSAQNSLKKKRSRISRIWTGFFLRNLDESFQRVPEISAHSFLFESPKNAGGQKSVGCLRSCCCPIKVDGEGPIAVGDCNMQVNSRKKQSDSVVSGAPLPAVHSCGMGICGAAAP